MDSLADLWLQGCWLLALLDPVKPPPVSHCRPDARHPGGIIYMGHPRPFTGRLEEHSQAGPG